MVDYKKYLGKPISIAIDRPIGSKHPSYPDMEYPINYVYILDRTDAMETDLIYHGYCKAVIHRIDDGERKLVAVMRQDNLGKYSLEDIKKLTEFQEKHFEIKITVYNPNRATYNL